MLSTPSNWEDGNFDLNLLVFPLSSFQKEVMTPGLLESCWWTPQCW